jgi:hypothetical protein
MKKDAEMNDKYTIAILEKGLRGNTLDDLVEGWVFKIDEVSSNVFKVDGVDKNGNRISTHDIDPKNAIAKCVNEARKINLRREYFGRIKSTILKLLKLK